MGWINYPLGSIPEATALTAPIVGPDGNLWCFGGYVTTGGSQNYAFAFDPATATLAGEANNYIGPPQCTVPVTDGTYVYESAPGGGGAGSVVRWTPGTMAFEQYDISTDYTTFDGCGLVMVGSEIVLTGAAPYGPYAESARWRTPSGGVLSYEDYGSTPDVGLGASVYDGTNVWAVETETNHLYQINPSTLAVTVYDLTETIPATDTMAYQMGFDGRYLYMTNNSGGVLVFDTVDLTDTVYDSGTSVTHCYYSENFNLVFVAGDGGGPTMYTMPVGGGSLTATGTGPPTSTASGFCDGPSGTTWCTFMAPGSGSISVYSPQQMYAQLLL